MTALPTPNAVSVVVYFESTLRPTAIATGAGRRKIMFTTFLADRFLALAFSANVLGFSGALAL